MRCFGNRCQQTAGACAASVGHGMISAETVTVRPRQKHRAVPAAMANQEAGSEQRAARCGPRNRDLVFVTDRVLRMRAVDGADGDAVRGACWGECVQSAASVAPAPSPECDRWTSRLAAMTSSVNSAPSSLIACSAASDPWRWNAMATLATWSRMMLCTSAGCLASTYAASGSVWGHCPPAPAAHSGRFKRADDTDWTRV